MLLFGGSRDGFSVDRPSAIMTGDKMTDLKPRIAQAATEPKAASDDSGSMTQHDLSQVIEADRYLKNETAKTGNRFRGIGMKKIVPPGN